MSNEKQAAASQARVFKALGLEQCQKLRSHGYLEFRESDKTNKRRANCKCCGKVLAKTEGRLAILFYGASAYSGSIIYLCVECLVKIAHCTCAESMGEGGPRACRIHP